MNSMYTKQIKSSWIGIGALLVLLVWSVLMFLFVLLYGAEAAGASEGTIAVPSVLLWLIPIGLVYVAWRWHVLGGFLFFLFGVATIFLFNTHESAVALLAISVPSIVLGALIMSQRVWDQSVELMEELST